MARGRLSVFRQLQRQARQATAGLRREIRSRETELGRLKQEVTRLSTLAGPVGRPTLVGSVRRTRTRVNWRAVLLRLPKQFKAWDIRKIPALRSKPSSDIFGGIMRWADAGLVKRKARGLYERVERSQERKPKEPAV